MRTTGRTRTARRRHRARRIRTAGPMRTARRRRSARRRHIVRRMRRASRRIRPERRLAAGRPLRRGTRSPGGSAPGRAGRRHGRAGRRHGRLTFCGRRRPFGGLAHRVELRPAGRHLTRGRCGLRDECQRRTGLVGRLRLASRSRPEAGRLLLPGSPAPLHRLQYRAIPALRPARAEGPRISQDRRRTPSRYDGAALDYLLGGWFPWRA